MQRRHTALRPKIQCAHRLFLSIELLADAKKILKLKGPKGEKVLIQSGKSMYILYDTPRAW